MPITDVPGKLNDNLHPFHLALDVLVEILLLHCGKWQKVDGTGILVWIGRDKGSEPLIDALGQEWRVRRLPVIRQVLLKTI